MGELIDEARFAHPRFAHDRCHLTATGIGELLSTAELLQLDVTADEPREPAPRGCLQAGPRRARSRHLVDFHGVGEPFHRHGAERLYRNEPFHQLQGRRRQEDAPRARELLHTRRQMGCLAHGRVVHVEIAANGAHDDLARVEPDPDLHVHAVRMARVFSVALHRLLHPERSVAGADSVILVGERRAEQRHDPVAHHLVDSALVAVHGFHHSIEDGVEELARLLGIAVGEELHRPLEIGEEHGDLLALAFQGGLGGEDLLGEVFGGIRLRGGRMNGGCAKGDRVAALEAEPGALW